MSVNSRVVRASSSSTAERRGVGLRALLDSRLRGGVKEEITRCVGVLGLNQAVELSVLGRLLAEDGEPEGGWVGRKVLANRQISTSHQP